MYTIHASSFFPKTYPSDIIFKLSKMSFTNLLYDKKPNKMAVTTTIMVELTDIFYNIYKAASIKHFKFYKSYFVVLCKPPKVNICSTFMNWKLQIILS